MARTSCSLLALVAWGLLSQALAQEPAPDGGAAQEAGVRRVALQVGQVAREDVGFARGLACDDPNTVQARIQAASPKSNVVVFEGLKAGTTYCRAGTADQAGPVVVLKVVVTPKR